MNENLFFKPSTSEEFSCDLRYSWNRRTFADGYYHSAKQLVEKVSEQCTLSDSYGPSIAFLFRHYVELMLKDILYLQTRFLGSPPPEDDSHKIDVLWGKIKLNLDQDFIDKFNGVLDHLSEIHPFCETELCIHEYTRMDPGGDAFRYPNPKNSGKNTKKKAGKSAKIRNQRSFDVVHLARKMESVEYFLAVLREYLAYKIAERESHQ